MAEKNTIDRFLENISGKELDSFDAKEAIMVIKSIAGKIPVNGEYDSAIIGVRIGEYIYAIQECGKILASLGLVEAFQETEVGKQEAKAALERAVSKGYNTAGERKLYAQMDEEVIEAKNKLNELRAVIMYIENYRTSLDKAHLHCKKILDRNRIEERFANDHERFGGSNKWINDDDLK